jgi:hypothetical protein
MIEIERKDDGRWIVEVPKFGILVYGATKGEALLKASILVLRVIEDRLCERCS